MRREAIVLLTGLLWALGAGAQTPTTEAPPTSPPDNEMSAEASIYARPRTPPRLEAREGRLVRPGDRVDANDVLDEIIDEFAADVARLGASRISPILLERVRVSENMNPEFASVLEARLVAAIYRAANVRVVRCYECYATHAQVEDGTWVVRRGLSRREDLQQVMKKYNAQVVLNASLTLYTAPNSFAFDVEMVRGDDASIFFAEGYRVHPHTALLYRSADKVQHREARLKDLEDRINARPRFNHSLHLGAIIIPTQNHPNGAIWAPYTAYRFTEAFGEERTWRAGGTVAAIINPTRIGGALLEATLLSRINRENVYSINCFGGGSVGFFLTGVTGNSPMINAQAECVLAHRITLQASLGYLVPFASSEDSTYFVGGVTPQLGMGFTW
ncbi:hypothetical protein [Cystobacter ferrugineus]|uniref:Uncharacterized protein n=1 Tax=Cystobacter ferrugineus TaxID=83449 RepID=A0A1L9BJK9_9BACT|nr:hypothetical protein [Cystobacter ferrugineus]OJH42482.1 hypothetical protein BON30_04615 [Cystobacter ferrugineus]